MMKSLIKFLIIVSAVFFLFSCATSKENNFNSIGTTYFNILDNDRPEILTDDPSDVRDIMVKIWYPAVREAGSKPVHMWYLTEEHQLPVQDDPSNYPQILNAASESYLNAEPLEGSFPVVMYSHGYNGHSTSNQLLIEHLVKKGYIVVSLVHNYQASIMIQHDGTLSAFDFEARANDFFLSDDATTTGDGLNNEIWDLFGKELADNQKDRIYSLMEWAAGDHKWIDYWIEDFNSVLSVLEKINRGDDVKLYNSVISPEQFKGIFDLECILSLGSSMGGIVSLDFSNRNANCIGAANLDAIHYSLKRNGIYEKPYLYMHQGGGPLPAARLVLEQQTAPAYLVGVDGTKHVDFTDGTYFMRDWFETGTIDGARMIELMNETVGLFFDSCLEPDNVGIFEEYIQKQAELSVLKN